MTAERYASLTDLQARLTERPSQTSALVSLLDTASAAVEDYCHRVFTLDAAASERVYVARLSELVTVDDVADPATAVVSTGSTSSWTMLAAADYWWGPVNSLTAGRPAEVLYATGAFPVSGAPSVKVFAKWGWPSVPAPVTEAVLLLASRLYARRSSPTGVAGFGDYGVVRVSSTDVDATGLLSGYVRPGIG